MIEVAGIGETMGQLVPADAGGLARATRFSLRVAGAESNVLVGLARLGHATALVTRLGEDALAERILDALRAHGVDTAHVTRDPSSPTGLFLKDTNGEERPVVYYRRDSAASRLGAADADRAIALGPRLVHTTGVTAALSSSCHVAVDRVLTRAAAGGTRTSFDVNYRHQLWSSVEVAAVVLLSLAERASIVFVGLDEARTLWGAVEPDEVRRLLPSPPILVVKDGARAAIAYGEQQRVEVPALDVDVVEPVGAGDAFAAGFLHGWLQGRPAVVSLRMGHVSARAALRSLDDVGDPVSPDELDTQTEDGSW